MELKFKKIVHTKCLRVQDMKEEPFEGVFVGPVEGNHGTNYKFVCGEQRQEVTVYGTKALRMNMDHVEPGYAVRIQFLSTVEKRFGGTYHDIDFQVSEEPVPGFDVTPYLSQADADNEA